MVELVDRLIALEALPTLELTVLKQHFIDPADVCLHHRMLLLNVSREDVRLLEVHGPLVEAQVSDDDGGRRLLILAVDEHFMVVRYQRMQGLTAVEQVVFGESLRYRHMPDTVPLE